MLYEVLFEFPKRVGTGGKWPSKSMQYAFFIPILVLLKKIWGQEELDNNVASLDILFSIKMANISLK